LIVKRIAIALFTFCFVAHPAHADGIKGVTAALGAGAVSSVLCTLTTVYGWGEADSPDEGFDRRGFFIGAGAGFAGEDFSSKPVTDIADIFGAGATATADDSWSVKGRGGYRCHPRYSVGATLEYFGGFDTQWTGALGAGSDDIDIFVATTDIKGYLLTGRYQPYLVLGGGVLHNKTKVTNPTGLYTKGEGDPVVTSITQSRSYTDFVVRLGGGFDVYATDHVVVNISAGYLFPLGEVSGVELFTAGGGIEYRF
jgi:hypothetical protein